MANRFPSIKAQREIERLNPSFPRMVTIQDTIAINLRREPSMNDNHLIVAGQQVQIGPMLSHMMLSSQDLQDRLLGLAGQTENIPETHFPVPETRGVITLQLALFGGFPVLTVNYIDNSYNATFEHVGGDSIEMLEMSFDEERNIIDWLENNRDHEGGHSQEETLPFANRFGDYIKVKVTDIEAEPVGDGTWIATGDVWEAYLDEGLQREVA